MDDLEELLPSTRGNRTLDELFEKLDDLDSVAKALQKEDITLAHVRILFAETVFCFPHASDRLNPDAHIILQPQLESGLVKLQNNNMHFLTGPEKDAVKRLRLKGGMDGEQSGDTVLSLAARVLKRQNISM